MPGELFELEAVDIQKPYVSRGITGSRHDIGKIRDMDSAELESSFVQRYEATSPLVVGLGRPTGRTHRVETLSFDSRADVARHAQILDTAV